MQHVEIQLVSEFKAIERTQNIFLKLISQISDENLFIDSAICLKLYKYLEVNFKMFFLVEFSLNSWYFSSYTKFLEHFLG